MKKILIICLCLIVLPLIATAQGSGGLPSNSGTSGGLPSNGGVSGGVPAQDGFVLKNPLNADTVEGAVHKIVVILLEIAAPIAVLLVVYAGYLLVFSRGREAQITEAKNTLLYVFVGIFVLVLSEYIVKFIIAILK